MADAAAQAAAQEAANRRLNDTISDLPKFYGTAKDTISAENLVDRFDSSILALGWNPGMAFEFFRMALHSEAEEWIKLVRETNAEYQPTWNFIKPLFKSRFGKRMDVAKVGTVLENLKMATVEVPINRGQNKPPGDNQMHNQGKHTCWYCNIPGHRQEECRKRIKDGKPCTELNGSTYWPKPKQTPMDEEKEGEGKGESEIIQGAIGEMYTGHLANVFSGFQ
jgi:hypothetical protein